MFKEFLYLLDQFEIAGLRSFCSILGIEPRTDSKETLRLLISKLLCISPGLLRSLGLGKAYVSLFCDPNVPVYGSGVSKASQRFIRQHVVLDARTFVLRGRTMLLREGEGLIFNDIGEDTKPIIKELVSGGLWVVYLITEIGTNRRYVGSSTRFYRRFCDWFFNKMKPSKLKDAIVAKGRDKFSLTILGIVREESGLDCLNEIETLFMRIYRSDSELFPFYNSVPFGGTTKGSVCSPAHRAKVAQSLIGNTRTLGYKHPPEMRARMSEWLQGNRSRTGMKDSDETRRRKSEAAKGNQNWLGRKKPKDS